MCALLYITLQSVWQFFGIEMLMLLSYFIAGKLGYNVTLQIPISLIKEGQGKARSSCYVVCFKSAFPDEVAHSFCRLPFARCRSSARKCHKMAITNAIPKFKGSAYCHPPSPEMKERAIHDTNE